MTAHTLVRRPVRRPARRTVLSALALAVVGGYLSGGASAASDPTWDRLAHCESSGRWDIDTGNGYYGGLQFSAGTWRAYGGAEFAERAHRATRAQQILVAERLLADRGWAPWPGCSAKLRLTAADAAGTPAPPSAPDALAEARADAEAKVERKEDKAERKADKAEEAQRKADKAVRKAAEAAPGERAKALDKAERKAEQAQEAHEKAAKHAQKAAQARQELAALGPPATP